MTALAAVFASQGGIPPVCPSSRLTFIPPQRRRRVVPVLDVPCGCEMMPGSPSGLGFLITQAYTVGRTDVVIAGMVCIGLTGAVLNRSCSLVETRCFSWKRAAR